MAARIEKENVRLVLGNILNDMSYWECDGKEAEKQLCYIAGVVDMANAIMRAIDELGCE